MPLPSPIPSKVAIHALRGIAFGTSCAIGVVLENRRRRISTIRSAISNKNKLRSAKRYHGTPNSAAALQLDDVVFVEEDGLDWYQPEKRTRSHGDNPISGSSKQPKNPDNASSVESASSFELEDTPDSSISASSHIQISSPPPTRHNTVALDSSRLPATSLSTRFDISKINTGGIGQAGNASILELRAKQLKESVRSISKILAKEDEGKLGRALKEFFEFSHLHYSGRQFDDAWIALSIRLSRECQTAGRWGDAGKVLTTTIDAGPLHEADFYSHEPLSILEFYLRQVDKKGRCPREEVAAATHLFLATFKEKPRMYITESTDIGCRLFSQSLMLGEPPVAHDIYWRILGLHNDPAAFIGWAIRELFHYGDYHSAIKYFLLNFSKTTPHGRNFNRTIECVTVSVEKLRGFKADAVLSTLHQMDRPLDGSLRTRWIQRLLAACWSRDHDFAKMEALFQETLSLGLLEKVKHPEGPWLTMVETAVRSERYDEARTYCEALISRYPYMVKNVTLKGCTALVLAKIGDWDGVRAVFTEMDALRTTQQWDYDQMFIAILKEFIKTHTAAEVRDFVAEFISDFGVRLHPYMMTLVGNKYGDCRDMPGFISWLAYCSKAGLAFDAGLCNTVLYNCRDKWNLGYNELRQLHSKLVKLFPGFGNDFTQRIMNMAAITSNQRSKQYGYAQEWQPKNFVVNKLAYTGRTANDRDLYAAIIHETGKGNAATAITIYNRAMKLGRPFSRECFGSVVRAALESPMHGFDYALGMIHVAHKQGDDVHLGVTRLIKYRLDQIKGDKEDGILHMRNLLSRLEALHIEVQPAGLAFMAQTCGQLGHHEKAIALCKLAADRSGAKSLCFSSTSTRVYLMAYSQTLNIKMMKRLLDDIAKSKHFGNTHTLVCMKSALRTLAKLPRTPACQAMRAILNVAIDEHVAQRKKIRLEGRQITAETLKIMQDALADSSTKSQSPVEGEGEDGFKGEGEGEEQVQDENSVADTDDNSRAVAALG